MGSFEVKEYMKKYMQLTEIEDESVREILRDEMRKLWYYFLTSDDKNSIKSMLK